MDISQFPEHFRAHVLSGIVRSSRAGISIRFGKLEGKVLPVMIKQVLDGSQTQLLPEELEYRARTTFSKLPYEFRIRMG